MAGTISELSVFLPTFNEGESIKEVVVKTKEVLQRLVNKWEIIVVNDGSQDSTKEIVESLKEGDARIKLINHDKNLGYGNSLKSGFYNAKYDWIAFIDSDNQFDFEEIKTPSFKI
jgi:glycosyltransferase involved in cell wall biosynthesis